MMFFRRGAMAEFRSKSGLFFASKAGAKYGSCMGSHPVGSGSRSSTCMSWSKSWSKLGNCYYGSASIPVPPSKKIPDGCLVVYSEGKA